MQIQTQTKQLILDRPHVMGILNMTPDSFSDGGRYNSLSSALVRAEEMIAAGVSIIDIGGESTRPGATSVTLNDELERVIPVIQTIHAKYPDVWISVDTSKAEVMRQSVLEGADIINDVRSLQEEGALEVAANAGVPVCLMHMQGQPQTMQDKPQYDDIVSEVNAFFQERISACENAGILRHNIIIDPGFGFGKTLAHNYHLLAHLEAFHQLGLPILAGLSRKSMLYKLLAQDPAECLIASVTSATVAAMKGAKIIRVHDVRETIEAMKIVQMIMQHH